MRYKSKVFRKLGYNVIRLISSGVLLIFFIYCLIFNQTLPFNLPIPIYIVATIFYAIFPLGDIFGKIFKPLYKQKYAKKNYIPKEYNEKEFKKAKRRYDIGALISIVLWLIFMIMIGILHYNNILNDMWILTIFGFFNFTIYFAIFFWCPFDKILIKPTCCMNCRIFNWDMFFNYSFLIFIPNIFTITLVVISIVSLLKWEITYYKHPERYYTASNAKLKCSNCTLEHCRKGKPIVKR